MNDKPLVQIEEVRRTAGNDETSVIPTDSKKKKGIFQIIQEDSGFYLA